MIDVSQIKESELLAALYNASKPLGMGHIHFTPEDMTLEQAEKLLLESTDFDYLHGRVMKVEINGHTLYPDDYDRDNGKGAAQRVVDSLL